MWSIYLQEDNPSPSYCGAICSDSALTFTKPSTVGQRVTILLWEWTSIWTDWFTAGSLVYSPYKTERQQKRVETSSEFLHHFSTVVIF
jgi:hypothetical protein